MRLRHGFRNDASLTGQRVLLNLALLFGHGFGNDAGLAGQRFLLNRTLLFGHGFGDNASLAGQRFLLNRTLLFGHGFGNNASLAGQRFLLNRTLLFSHGFGDNAGLLFQRFLLNRGLSLRNDARLFGQRFLVCFRKRFRHGAGLVGKDFGLRFVMCAVNRACNRVCLCRNGFFLCFLLSVEHCLGNDLRLIFQSFLANRFLRFGQRVRNGFGLLRERLRHQCRLESLRFLLTVDKLAHRFGQQRGLRFGNHIGNHLSLFRGIHAERRRPAKHRHGRSFCGRFQNRLFLRVKQFLLRFQQFRLCFALSLRHGFRLLFQQFVGLNPRLRRV